MLMKKQFKLLAIMPKRDGGTYWMRCGSAYTNKDDSINVYLDALPKGGEWKFQLRELDEEDLKRREGRSLLPRPLDGGVASAGGGLGVDSVPF